MMTITAPGVYDMPAETYHADPVPGGSLSSSGARLLLPPNCPAIYRHRMDTPQPSNATYEFGHAAHLMVLGSGPELVRINAEDYRGKLARGERDEARARGAVPLLAHEHDHVEAMAAVLWQHPIAQVILAPGRGRAEQSLFWSDATSGVNLRARLDWLPNSGPGRMVVADYKTTSDASPVAIERAMASYGYHQQAAWYLDGVRALGLADDAVMVLICQDKNPPYLVTVVQPDGIALGWGRTLNRKAIDIYRQCTSTGDWPGYGDAVLPACLPRWADYAYDIAQANGDYLLEDAS